MPLILGWLVKLYPIIYPRSLSLFLFHIFILKKAMHPQLEAHKDEGCDGVIEALEQCHRAGTFNRFIGVCNDAKRAVDQCLTKEVR
jgi:hypothetical protein